MNRSWNGLRAWVSAVTAVGVLVIAQSLVSLQTTPHRWEWLFFAALTAVAGSFSLKLGSISVRVTISDTFFITTALLFGPAPATLAVALGTLVSSWRRGHARERVAFNTSACAIAIWAGSQVFFSLAGVPPLTQVQSPVVQLVVPLLALTAVYFLTNTLLIAIAVGLEAGRPTLSVWCEHFLWLTATYFAAASVSFCLVLVMYEAGLTATILVLLPLLLVLHLTLRSSIGRLEDASRHVAHLDRLYLSTVETLAMAIDAKDDVTHSHVRRVQAYALGLARALGVNDDETLKAIEAAALLHDTGKLAVPEHILNKPGKLNEVEFEQMKRHVDVGADILSLVEFPYPVVPIVRCHHENWDGTGYPRGVKGTDIPIGARILSVVDCFDALTSDRPYRGALTDEQAFEVLRARRGTMYEPLVVDTFMRVHRELAEQMSAFQTHDALRQITRSVATAPAPPPAVVVTSGGVSDDVLAFVSLARLAAGDASMSDALALASNLMSDLAPGATIAWYTVDEGSGYVAVRHAAGPAASQVSGTTLRIGEGVSGWVAAHRQLIVNSQASLDLGKRAHTGAPLEHALSVPLITRETLVGTVTLYSTAAFSESQSRLLQLIAPHLAQVIWTTNRDQAAVHTSQTSRPANGSDRRVVATSEHSRSFH